MNEDQLVQAYGGIDDPGDITTRNDPPESPPTIVERDPEKATQAALQRALDDALALTAAIAEELRSVCPECRTPAETGNGHTYSCPAHRGLSLGFVTPAGYLFEGRGECRSCAASVGWASNKSTGRRAPFDPDGTSHFATCPQADRWRKRGNQP
jgi:hypothetical protein